MRNQWGLGVVVGLILAFPLLLCLVALAPFDFSDKPTRGGSPLIAVETVVVGGLLFARRERQSAPAGTRCGDLLGSHRGSPPLGIPGQDESPCVASISGIAGKPDGDLLYWRRRHLLNL